MKSKGPLVAVIGAGQVGATTAQRIIEKNIADVVLFDVVEGLPQGKALDLAQASAIEGHGRSIVGTNRYEDIQGAAIVVVTAGLPRKPGMSREDLLLKNAQIVSSVTENIKKYAPTSKIIVVTNPLDIMTYLAFKISGFSTNCVMGMAGVLDTARMQYFVAQELKDVAPHEVEAVVLGGHGDLMVPVSRLSRVKNRPLTELLSADKIRFIEDKTRNGGAEIVQLLKTGSAFYAPASSASLMAQSILTDKKATLPLCAYLNGEYGLSGIYFGVTAVLGKNGIEKVCELPLNDTEKKELVASAERVRQGVIELEVLLKKDLPS